MRLIRHFTNLNLEAKTTMVRLLVILTLASLRFGYAQCPALDSASGEPPAVSVDVATKQNPAKADSPLWVEVTMTNQSDHAISFWKNTNVNAYPIEVSDETGTPLPDKRPGFRNGRFDPKLLDPKHLDPKLVDSGELIKMLSGSLTCVTLKPGERLVDRIDVTKFYNMNSPGAYTISVEGHGSAKAAGVKPRSVRVVVAK